MTDGPSSLRAELARALIDALGLLPHIVPLLQAIGPFGLDPRVRELAALAVARARRGPRVVALHRAIGAAAGVTEREVDGEIDGLTTAERSAMALALGTVGRPPGGGLGVDQADEHYTPEQIRQLQAVALAVDLGCTCERALSR